MKSRKNTIKDKSYFYGLSVLFKSLYAANIPAVLVGGTAVQVRIAHALAKHNNSKPDISKINNIEKYLRPTNDYDICALCKDDALQKVIQGLNIEEEIDDEIYQIEVSRNGIVKPKIKVYSLNGAYNETEIVLNFSRNASNTNFFKDYYDEMIFSGEEISLFNEQLKAEITVAKPEYIVAAKLMRGKERDFHDINLLLNFEKIDKQELARIMKHEIYRFENLTDLNH